MTEYIKELEARNELLSNRLEAAEKTIDDFNNPINSTYLMLETIVKNNLEYRKELSPDSHWTDFCKICFHNGRMTGKTTAAHKLAYNLFENCLYICHDMETIRRNKMRFRGFENVNYECNPRHVGIPRFLCGKNFNFDLVVLDCEIFKNSEVVDYIISKVPTNNLYNRFIMLFLE